MTTPPLPPAEYYASLPRSIAGAGVLFHDEAGRVLLVKPAYREGTWEVPGGAMEAGEFPWETARREVKEELDLELGRGRLLGVDWVPGRAERLPLVVFVFDGGPVTEEWVRRRVRLPAEELTDWRMAPPAQWPVLLAPHTARRVAACARALGTGDTVYLQHGWEPA
ncbi:NUDIX hydrolase [Streptomyces capparidis]